MGENTGISWTDHTFNIAWGCQKVSPGCSMCYAETFSNRVGQNNIWGAGSKRRTFGEKHWHEPAKWNKRAAAAERIDLVFCSSMCDVFEDHRTITQERTKLWELIRQTPHLHWQLLTKRADRIADCLPDDWGDGWPNVWLGVSVENEDYLWRVAELRSVPALVRFVSYEPALGPLYRLKLQGMDQVIYGGESGPGYRPDQLAWAILMANTCQRTGTAFFYKQRSSLRPGVIDPWAKEHLPQQFPVVVRRPIGVSDD